MSRSIRGGFALPVLALMLSGCAASAVAQDMPARANFSSCAKPEYPAAALAEKRTGAVTLAFLVDTDGKTVESKVAKSSGHADLDETARLAIAKCSFSPAITGGKPVQSWQPVQYVWTLN